MTADQMTLDAVEPGSPVEPGSRWYYARKHWQVIAMTTRDHAPAVMLRNAQTGKPLRVPVDVAALERYGRPA
jgi:hypothetical protein